MSEILFHYDQGTSHAVAVELEKAYFSRKGGRPYRVRLFYGDTQTGRDWCEEYDTQGYIGRSTGSKPIALLVHNSRSLGGAGILTACIVRISINGRDVYRHPKYYQPEFTVTPADSDLAAKGYHWSVFADGQNVANFKTQPQAARWIAFIKGDRNSK